jgi:hypothetical protein
MLSREKKIQVVLFHINSHQKDNFTNNDIADEYAKKSLLIDEKLNKHYNIHNIKDHIFIPDRYSIINEEYKIIDYNTRSFLKFKMFEKIKNKWTYKQYQSDNELQSEIDISKFFYDENISFNRKISYYSSKNKQSNIDLKRIYINKKKLNILVKSRLNMLPTNLFINKIYRTGNPKCILCDKNIDESVIHMLLECPKYDELRIKLIKNVIYILKSNSDTSMQRENIELWFINYKINIHTNEIIKIYLNKINKVNLFEICSGILGIYTDKTKDVLEKLKIKESIKIFRKIQILIIEFIEELWSYRCRENFKN